jgi:FkbM family methyltransferase
MKIKVHGFEFVVDDTKPKDHKFWNTVNNGKWEPHTFYILDRFLNLKKSMIDLGAWIGPTTLYGSMLSKCVHAVEPDPVALGSLLRNVQLNQHAPGKVLIWDHGISHIPGNVILSAKGKFRLGESGSSIIHSDKVNERVAIRVITFDDFVKRHQIVDCGFIKMDIEGAEYKVLPTMGGYILDYLPTLYVSFHRQGRDEADFAAIEDVLSHYDNFYDARTMKKIQLKGICNHKEVVCN